MAKFDISFGVSIDTAKIEKGIKDITQRMQELAKKGTINGLKIDPKDIQNYMSQMKSVYDALDDYYKKKQFRVGTGPTGRPNMAAEQARLATAVANMNLLTQRPPGGAAGGTPYNEQFGKAATENIVKMGNEATKTAKKLDLLEKPANKLAKSFEAIATFSVAAYGFRGLTGTIESAVGFVKDLDKALTNIRVVTGATDQQLKGYAQNYIDMAKELGRSTVEIAEAANEYYRQGRTQAETMDLVRATMVGAKIAGEDLVTTTQSLTATINGFQLSANQSMQIIDKFAALDAASATSFKEMSYALTKVASSAHNAGITIDEMLGMIATVSEVTRRICGFIE